MSKTSLKQVIEEKWGYCSNVSKTIVKQGIEGSLVYCANGQIGIITPMSKTRLKQGSEDKWGDRSNVSIQAIVIDRLEYSRRVTSRRS